MAQRKLDENKTERVARGLTDKALQDANAAEWISDRTIQALQAHWLHRISIELSLLNNTLEASIPARMDEVLDSE